MGEAQRGSPLLLTGESDNQTLKAFRHQGQTRTRAAPNPTSILIIQIQIDLPINLIARAVHFANDASGLARQFGQFVGAKENEHQKHDHQNFKSSGHKLKVAACVGVGCQ